MSRITINWFLLGLSIFGFLIGFLAGISVSPVAGTLLGLLFAFIGGSVIVLVKGHNQEEIRSIGKSITALSVCLFIGVVLGINLRGTEAFIFGSSGAPPYTLPAGFTADDVFLLSEAEVETETLCTIIKFGIPKTGNNKIKKETLIKKLEKKPDIDPRLIYALFIDPSACNRTSSGKASQSNTLELHANQGKRRPVPN